jgi:hypothetical protein
VEDLDRLISEYYEVLAGAGSDGDGHWQVSERWSYGRHLGWFLEHHGKCYRELGADGEEGPYRSYEAARASMAEHLTVAIGRAGRRDG